MENVQRNYVAAINVKRMDIMENCVEKDHQLIQILEEEMSIYAKLASELSVTAKGIVIPTTMRRSIIDIAHEGHQGLVKTKSLIRAKVWFPYMDVLTDEVVKNCSTCAVVTKDERLQPLQMSELPDKAWQSVCADFCGPYPR